PPDDGRLASFKTDARPDPDSPAGLILYARVRAPGEVMDFVSDGQWTIFIAPPPTTDRFAPADKTRPENTGRAIELGGIDLEPWKLGRHFLEIASARRDGMPVERASLVFNDPLMAALGRPNREQVVTVRQTTPTTLQALELTNGNTLATFLKRGSDAILSANPRNTPGLIADLY